MKHIFAKVLLVCLTSILFTGCVMPVGPSDDFSGLKKDVFSNLIRKNIRSTSVFKSEVDKWPVYVGTDEYTDESFKLLQGKKESEVISLFQSNNGKCSLQNAELLQCTLVRGWKKKAQSSFARAVDWYYNFGNYNDPVLQIDYSIHLENGGVESIECRFIDLTEKN